jgi:hypothetical protein
VTNCNQQNDCGGCRKHAGECWSSLSLYEVQFWYAPGRTNRNCSWSLAPHQLSLHSTIIHTSQVSCAMAQAVSHQPLATQALVQSQVRPCGVCGGQDGTGTGFLCLLQLSLPASFHQCSTHIHSWITDTITSTYYGHNILSQFVRNAVSRATSCVSSEHTKWMVCQYISEQQL